MAEYFSITRPFLSDDLIMLKKYLKPNSKVLDLGMGNGRLSTIVNYKINIDYIGIDVSEKMVRIASKNYPDCKFLLQKNPLKIDFENSTFDRVFCLSVFHHIPSYEYRLAYLKEIKRVLKKEGIVVMLNWNLWPKKGTCLKVLLDFFKHRELDLKDIYLPFKNEEGKNLTNRYIHCFSKYELDNLLAKAGFAVKESTVLKRGRKISNSNFLHILSK